MWGEGASIKAPPHPLWVGCVVMVYTEHAICKFDFSFGGGAKKSIRWEAERHIVRKHDCPMCRANTPAVICKGLAIPIYRYQCK